MALLWCGGAGPREVPVWAFGHLVVVHRIDPDWLALLRCVEQLDYYEDRPVHLIRIFDPRMAPGVKIEDFASLDRCPELILCEGCKDLETGKIVLFRITP